MLRVLNKNARMHILRKEPFVNRNDTMWARWDLGRYCVYSYGEHHMMWCFDPETELWFGNEAYQQNLTSRTTARHHSLTAPPTVHHWVDSRVLGQVRAHGWPGYLAERMAVRSPRTN